MNLLSQSSFLNDQSAPYLIVGAGIFLITYVVIRPFLKRKKDPMDKPSFSRSLSQQRSVERQMESLLVELSEMTRQMSAQLDTRSTRLELLIKEADEKIERLSRVAREDPSSRLSPVISADEPVPAAPTSEVDPRHMEIYALADQGKSIPEIATALMRPSGEVELILALRAR